MHQLLVSNASLWDYSVASNTSNSEIDVTLPANASAILQQLYLTAPTGSETLSSAVHILTGNDTSYQLPAAVVAAATVLPEAADLRFVKYAATTVRPKANELYVYGGAQGFGLATKVSG